MRPLLDIHAKEGKDKKVNFDAGFTKPNCKCKWFFRKDVSIIYSHRSAKNQFEYIYY